MEGRVSASCCSSLARFEHSGTRPTPGLGHEFHENGHGNRGRHGLDYARNPICGMPVTLRGVKSFTRRRLVKSARAR